MKNTLVVSYTPRIGSNTKKLLDYFIEINSDKSNFSILDLTVEVPDLLLANNLNLWFKRDSQAQLEDHETKLLAKNDKILSQLLETDYLVLAYPMYNFSLPATVKAWIDAVIKTNATFEINDKGEYIGLCKNIKSIVLMTTGGDYADEPLKSINFATPLITQQLGFMGISSDHVSAYALDERPQEINEILEKAKKEIKKISLDWYL